MSLLNTDQLLEEATKQADRLLANRGLTVSQLSKHPQSRKDVALLLHRLQHDVQYNKLKYFEPYEYQRPLYHLHTMAQAVIASNRSGKSYSVGYAIACHLTGQYPEWWTDIKYKRGIKLIAAGSSSSQIREAIQETLFGTADKSDEGAVGSGLLPKDSIILESMVTGADRRSVGGCQIKHISGIPSQIVIASYEQDRAVLQGGKADVIWLDEQPRDDEIVSELIRALAQTPSGQEGRLYLSATPLVGWTPMIKRFWNKDPHHGMVRYSWDDVPLTLLDQKTRELLRASWLPWEIESRTQGIPMAGTGAVFQVDWKQIIVDVIPPAQPSDKYIAGIDFGRNPDPTAIIWMRLDSNDTVWAYDEHIAKNQTPVEYTPHILSRNQKIPLAWPRDGKRKGYTETSSVIAELTNTYGVNTLSEPFTNPDGSIGIDYGLQWIIQRMRMGKFKISSHCKTLIDEMMQYHTETSSNGKVSFRGNDHCIDGLRYGALSIHRFGQQLLSSHDLTIDLHETQRWIQRYDVNYY